MYLFAMRDDVWLKLKFEELYESHFCDVPRLNSIEIGFGRKAKRRFGSISLGRDKKTSVITINGVFRDERVPEQIICSVMAHELCHYVHGFNSPLPKKYDSPHAGGVIKRELKKRGLSLLEEYEKMWTRANWPKFSREVFGVPLYRAHRFLRLPKFRLW
ncbi:MAG: hypothetical protein WC897_03675 [Candidatus Gracilibacteria bacterium]